MPNKICGRERGGVAVAAQARPLWSGLVWSGMVSAATRRGRAGQTAGNRKVKRMR